MKPGGNDGPGGWDCPIRLKNERKHEKERLFTRFRLKRLVKLKNE